MFVLFLCYGLRNKGGQATSGLVVPNCPRVCSGKIGELTDHWPICGHMCKRPHFPQFLFPEPALALGRRGRAPLKPEDYPRNNKEPFWLGLGSLAASFLGTVPSHRQLGEHMLIIIIWYMGSL